MKSNTTLLILLLLGGALAFGGGQAVQAFANSINVSGIRVNNFRFPITRLEFDLTFTIMNPTQLPLVFERIMGNVFYNNNIRLASLESNFSEVTVAAGQSSEVTLQARVPLGDLAVNVITLINNGFQFPNMRMAGSVFSKGIAIPFDKTILKVG